VFRPGACENFLYVFKAARRAARAATSAARLRSRCRSGGQAPVGWRENQDLFSSRAAMTFSRQRAVQSGGQDLDVVGSRSVIVRGGQNPSRAPSASLRADP
jgi:hypothetical protein